MIGNVYHHHNRFTALFPDHPGEPVPEENFWVLWCKGRLTETDKPTIQLGATLSGPTIAHRHHHSIAYSLSNVITSLPKITKIG